MKGSRLKPNVTAFVAGLVFGVGLLVSGMTRPSKVLGFLDFGGDWDPSLMLVMGGAIAVHALFARRVRARAGGNGRGGLLRRAFGSA